MAVTFNDSEKRFVDYRSQNIQGKKQLVKFIQKQYPEATLKEISNGTYKAVLQNNLLVGVAYMLKR